MCSNLGYEIVTLDNFIGQFRSIRCNKVIIFHVMIYFLVCINISTVTFCTIILTLYSIEMKSKVMKNFIQTI
jgi:hypothetical protein